MISARLKYEMDLIAKRIAQMWPEYERNKSPRQEHITDIKFNKKTYFVQIMMCTYAYKISHEDDHYVIEWFRVNDNVFIKDGFVHCDDLSATVRTLNDYLYSGFSPARGPWWMLNPKPKFNRRNKRWA